MSMVIASAASAHAFPCERTLSDVAAQPNQAHTRKNAHRPRMPASAMEKTLLTTPCLFNSDHVGGEGCLAHHQAQQRTLGLQWYQITLRGKEQVERTCDLIELQLQEMAKTLLAETGPSLAASPHSDGFCLLWPTWQSLDTYASRKERPLAKLLDNS